MAQVIFGEKPKTFAPIDVSFIHPNGQEIKVNVVFKYRTKTEFGLFMKQTYASAGVEQESGADFDFERLMTKNVKQGAESLILCIDSWSWPGFDIEINKETMYELADGYPAAVVALGNSYRVACVEGRLGN